MRLPKREHVVAAVLVSMLTALVAESRVSAEELPPGPSFPVQSTFQSPAPAEPYEVVQLVLDFPPGNWTPRHTHGGQVFVTVLSGEATIRNTDGSETKYRAGSTWRETPGDYHAVGNATGENVRVLATFLLPRSASLTTVEDSTPTDQLPPGPNLVYQTRADGRAFAGQGQVVQLVGDFAPGTWTPRHEHGGLGLVTTTDGRITVRDAAGERSFGPGEGWIEGVGEIASVGNATDQPGRLVASFVLPPGEALTTVREESVAAASGTTGATGGTNESTVVQPAALPSTGGEDGSVVALALAGLVALLAGGAVAVGRGAA